MGLGTLGGGAARFKRPRALFRAAALATVSGIAILGLAAETIAQQFRFDRFVIEGNQRIGDAAILNQAGLTQGQAIGAGQLNDAVQRLQNSGFFETVEVDPQGNTLRITVVELPTINRIGFEGNRRINDDALAAVIQSTERRVFNPAQAERDASAIAEAYANAGRSAAQVSPRIIRRSDNRVDLIFEVFEGDVVEIERISFVGNRNFSDRRLRRVLETRQAGLLRAFVRTDTLVEDRIEFDKQVLRDFYLSRGYVDFRVNSANAEITEERDGFFLVFNVQEGQQFRFGEVTLVNELPEIDDAEFESLIKIRPGVVYSPTLIEEEISRMERQGIRQGIDFLRVEPRITRNDRDLTLDVEFVLSRGPRVFVERIDIEGNTTTLDRVIRRQFTVAEGDPFNPRQVREAAERIRALGYFANADVNAREGSTPDQVVVDVDVEEQPTGSLNFGGSYSVNDGFGIVISFRENNFVGRGQQLSLTLSTATENQEYSLRFVEPRFLGRDVAFGLELDYNTSDSTFLSYDSEELIFQPSLTFPVGERSRLELRYTADQSEMTERDPSENGAVVGNEIAAGEQFASSLGYTYSYDSRLSGLNPNAGYLFEFSQDLAGLGGDSEYLRTTAKVIGQQLVFGEEVTLRATLEGGMLNWNGGANRTIDRFLLNPNIMRGFEPAGIGPRDNSGSESNALGGNLYAVARFEAEFPLGLPEEYGIRGGVFYDVGNLWDLDGADLSGGSIVGEDGSFRHVIGFAILWDTPIGPLRFNFTEALEKEDFDEEQSFDLTISTRF
ncbi:MAG: outer membrane protein assembly factor BamA [Pseudomonadota bacterium]